MDEETAYGLAYNAHERADCAARDAMRRALEDEPVEALAILADPQWNWQSRSPGGVSAHIIDIANEVCNEKLDALVGVGFGL